YFKLRGHSELNDWTRHKAYLYCVFLLVSLIRIVRFVVMHDKLDVNLLGFFFLVHQQYHFINKSLTWYEAQSFCRLKYTDLATINDTDDENRLINTLGSNVTSSWIGLYNGQTNRWLWSDGSGIASFTQWSPDEPNNSGGIESCGLMYDNGLWNDAYFKIYADRSTLTWHVCIQNRRI
uniref:C-type lectin domain-containing protein n=1 Tax=Oreochromis niloticus TaxID=8128 RepID=A0A669F904_ORENI